MKNAIGAKQEEQFGVFEVGINVERDVFIVVVWDTSSCLISIGAAARNINTRNHFELVVEVQTNFPLWYKYQHEIY